MRKFISEIERWLAEEALSTERGKLGPEDHEAAVQRSIVRQGAYDAVLQLAKLQSDALQAFFYFLLRDKLPAGEVERLVGEACSTLGNEHIAGYAAELRARVLGDKP